jgi:hypothetical protein
MTRHTAPSPVRCKEPGCPEETHYPAGFFEDGRCRRHHFEHMNRMFRLPMVQRARAERREERSNDR